MAAKEKLLNNVLCMLMQKQTSFNDDKQLCNSSPASRTDDLWWDYFNYKTQRHEDIMRAEPKSRTGSKDRFSGRRGEFCTARDNFEQTSEEQQTVELMVWQARRRTEKNVMVRNSAFPVERLAHALGIMDLFYLTEYKVAHFSVSSRKWVFNFPLCGTLHFLLIRYPTRPRV